MNSLFYKMSQFGERLQIAWYKMIEKSANPLILGNWKQQMFDIHAWKMIIMKIVGDQFFYWLTNSLVVWTLVQIIFTRVL